MTTVKVLERNGNILKVKGLDMVDGTPHDAVEGMKYPDWVNKLEY